LKQLIVNADDFGFTHDVNAGIIEAHTRGILTATTLMANGSAFDDAVKLARQCPTLDIGCHLVLVGGPGQPPTVGKLLLSRPKPYLELRGQIEKILDAGIKPTHLDTHKHTHLYPPVLAAVVRLAEEYGIKWVRRPFGPFSLWSRRMLGNCRTTDHFAGFRMTGKFNAGDVVRLIERLPEGLTEFMVHPGRCTAELRAAPTRLKESRERELAALTAPEVRAALTRNGVTTAGFPT
jgi:predicted glycoside hydrolase/deacetylase ChbG (UPF0249 family)